MSADGGAYRMIDSGPRGPLGRMLDALYFVTGCLAGIFLVVIFLLMMALSAGRQFGFNVPAGDDFASWCMAAMAFLGLAYTFRSGEMIRVGLLLQRLSGRRLRLVELMCLAIGVVFMGYFTWHAAIFVWESWRFNAMAQGVLAIPLWIPQLGFLIGTAMLFVALVDELVHVLRGGDPRYEKPPPASAEEAVERAAQSAV